MTIASVFTVLSLYSLRSVETVAEPRVPDVVSDVLATVRVRSTVYCRSEMRAPWGFGVQAHGNPSFHVVTRGDCWLEVDGEDEPAQLTAGELILLPHGPMHWLRADPTAPTLWLDEILAGTPPDGNGRLQHGGNGAMTEFVCGGFVLEGQTASPILAKLRPVIRVARDETGPAPWLAATLDLVRTLTQSNGPGAEAVLARVADTMLTQVLRLEFASGPVDALHDPQIATAIHLIHARPADKWTVARLAEEVAYSRSAFASRFRDLVGESPMGYVTRTRLAIGAGVLERTNTPIREIARRCGYASEASFSRAFKRAFGIAPGAYRSA
jgi:AraC family transcriptional regulator, alkane utilization regulator